MDRLLKVQESRLNKLRHIPKEGLLELCTELYAVSYTHLTLPTILRV